MGSSLAARKSAACGGSPSRGLPEDQAKRCGTDPSWRYVGKAIAGRLTAPFRTVQRARIVLYAAQGSGECGDRDAAGYDAGGRREVAKTVPVRSAGGFDG